MSKAFMTTLPASQKLVLIVMCDYANDDGLSCHPSVAQVAVKASLSDRQCKRVLKQLQDLGYLSVIANEHGGKPGTTRHYRIDIKRLERGGAHDTRTGDADDTPTGDIHDTGDKLTRVTPEVRTGDTGDTGGVTPRAKRGDTHDTQPTIDPSVNHQRTTSGAREKFKPEDHIPPPLDRETWIEFCRFRRADLKKPIKTIRSVTPIANDFEQHGLTAEQARACVLDSIKNEYQGVFPAKFANWKPARAPSESFSQTDYTAGVTSDGRLS